MKRLKAFSMMMTTVLSCLFGSVHAQQSAATGRLLSPQEESIIVISGLTAIGDLTKLKPALNTGLKNGLSINEIKEVLIHLYAYCGFPRSLRGIQTFMAVLDERKAKGINDKVGPKASLITDKRTKYERGKEILEKLTGVKSVGPATGYARFAPEIEIFLKEHLFADLFERDILTYAQRELVTVSVTASIGGVEPMLGSHMEISLTSGVTPNQLKQLVKLIELNVGIKEGSQAKKVLADVLKRKGLNADADNTQPADAMKDNHSATIFPKGEKVTNDNFVGAVWVQSLVDGDSLNPNAVGCVTFEAGARTKWHFHPAGQIILALDGEGYYQEKGNPKRILKKGDVVKCPPNTPHWHGAAKDRAFIQVAITGREKGPTQWLEAVSDQEYNSTVKEAH